MTYSGSSGDWNIERGDEVIAQVMEELFAVATTSYNSHWWLSCGDYILSSGGRVICCGD